MKFAFPVSVLWDLGVTSEGGGGGGGKKHRFTGYPSILYESFRVFLSGFLLLTPFWKIIVRIL